MIMLMDDHLLQYYYQQDYYWWNPVLPFCLQDRNWSSFFINLYHNFLFSGKYNNYRLQQYLHFATIKKRKLVDELGIALLQIYFAHCLLNIVAIKKFLLYFTKSFYFKIALSQYLLSPPSPPSCFFFFLFRDFFKLS